MGLIEREYMHNETPKQKNRVKETYFREEHVDYVLPALYNLETIEKTKLKKIIKKLFFK